MIKEALNEYRPDSVTPAGDTLSEILAERKLSQAELATRMGRPIKTINEIIKGKNSILPETALQLEKVLGVPAAFWLNREQRYQEYLARLKETDDVHHNRAWIKGFPIKSMMDQGWIRETSKTTDLLRELFTFFGVASIKAWGQIWSDVRVSYRKSEKVSFEVGAIRAWLRKGEIDANESNTQPYNENLFREKLIYIKSLTNESPTTFVPKIKQYCAEAGVVITFTPELPKSPICGATRWLSKDKALIQLSLRYKTDDHLWFTFFHEAGHILLHGKKEVFVDLEKPSTSESEEEASKFAVQQLIDKHEWESFVRKGNFNKRSVIEFANHLNIAGGIIVGQLQHNKLIPFNRLNDLKKRFVWSENE